VIALEYTIPLPAGFDTRRIRQRVRQKAPLFDAYPGLLWKAFLLREPDPAYGAFYLWESAEAAASFLDGPLFAGVVESFGRPEVRLWLVREAVAPPPSVRWARREERALVLAPNRAAHVVGVDPTGWRVVHFGFEAARSARDGWEVLHLSRTVSFYHTAKSLTSPATVGISAAS
jgi:hypothetical protein